MERLLMISLALPAYLLWALCLLRACPCELQHKSATPSADDEDNK